MRTAWTTSTDSSRFRPLQPTIRSDTPAHTPSLTEASSQSLPWHGWSGSSRAAPKRRNSSRDQTAAFHAVKDGPLRKTRSSTRSERPAATPSSPKTSSWTTPPTAPSSSPKKTNNPLLTSTSTASFLVQVFSPSGTLSGPRTRRLRGGTLSPRCPREPSGKTDSSSWQGQSCSGA